MDKQIAALEISNRYYELVIGYVLDNKVDILYKTKQPLSVPYRDGDIFDIGSLSDDLSKINNIEVTSGNHKLTIKVNEVVLVLPSYGLEVYRSQKTTNTVSNISKIAKIDITNALALVKKERLPNINNVLVDIIPNRFIIDTNQQFLVPPLNETSRTVSIDANVYTLPRKMVDDLKSACERANLKVKREVISPVGVSKLLEGLNFKYPTYILVDFSNKTTTLSFIGNNTVFSSNFFSLGIDDLIEKYINDFGISREKAIEIKNIYGLDARKTDFCPYIASSTGSDGILRKYNKEDVANATLAFLKTWINYFTGSFKTLIEPYKNLEKDIPLIVTGEGSSLNGLKDYILRAFSSNPLEILYLPTISASKGEYSGCLGAIYFTSGYRGALEDENQGHVAELNRTSEPLDRKERVKEKYDELRDEL